MVETVPRQRRALFEAIPEVAALAEGAVRLHPRRATPTAEQSSAGAELIWPVDEPWPVCTDVHLVDRVERVGESFRRWSEEAEPAEPVVLAPVVQLFKRDIPGDHAHLPGWMFPAHTDVLQILWCPNRHVGTIAPQARAYWRDTHDLHDAVSKKPELNLVALPDAVPVPCLLHPELVSELPPLPGVRDHDLPLWSAIPAELLARLRSWQHPDEEPWEDESHYEALATAPGWKVGGWAEWAGNSSDPPTTCPCGAPTRLMFDALGFEDLDSWWVPAAEPLGFVWGAPRDWTYVEPTKVSIGRNDCQAVFACTADPGHPLMTYVE